MPLKGNISLFLLWTVLNMGRRIDFSISKTFINLTNIYWTFSPLWLLLLFSLRPTFDIRIQHTHLHTPTLEMIFSLKNTYLTLCNVLWYFHFYFHFHLNFLIFMVSHNPDFMTQFLKSAIECLDPVLDRGHVPTFNLHFSCSQEWRIF